MNQQHFTLDVYPAPLWAARQRLKRVLAMLDEQTPEVRRTPRELPDWRGSGANRVKHEMTALARQLDRAAPPLEVVSRALANLAQTYSDARAEVQDLNRRWRSAVDEHGDTVRRANDRYQLQLSRIGQDGGDTRTARDRLSHEHRNSLDHADATLQRAQASVRGDFEDLRARLRQETRATARVLAESVLVTPTELELELANGGFSNKLRGQCWGDLARDRLADALPLAAEHQRLVEFSTALEAYGMTVPASFDATRAAELRRDLNALLDRLYDRDEEARAKAVNEWAEALDDTDLSLLTVFEASFVGGLPGMPNRVRYAANHLNVAEGVAAEIARLESWPGKVPGEKEPGYADYERLKDRIATLNSLLTEPPLVQPPGGGDPVPGPPHQILFFELPTYDGTTTTDDGRLAVVMGDLDNASYVATVVPGITNRIDNFENTLSKARNVHEQVPGSATVAWLGYDTPEFADMFTEDVAEEGGRALASFQATIVRNPAAETTVVAHSYGTLVTSKALQYGMRPDRVVFMGSPGLGQGIRSRKDLGIPDDIELYALRAQGDGVSVTAAHGMDPADMEGIIRLDTDWQGAENVTGHSDYTTYLDLPDGSRVASDSLVNIAGVVEGYGTTPRADGKYLRAGGNPLEQDGFMGRHNDEMRRFVALLMKRVPPEETAAFVAALEPRALDYAQAPANSIGLGDAGDISQELYRAMNEAGLDLTPSEVAVMATAAGFTNELGKQAGEGLKSWIHGMDGMDDLVVPVMVPTPLGSVRVDVPVPDQTNEALGSAAGLVARSFVTSRTTLAALGGGLGLDAVVAVGKDLNRKLVPIRYGVEVVKKMPDLVEAASRTPLNPRTWRLP